MRLPTGFAAVFFALACVVLPQSVRPQQPQLDNKYGATIKKAAYLKNAQLARQQYDACEKNNANSSVPPSCQLYLNSAAYYQAMAAAVVESGDVPAATQKQLAQQHADADAKFNDLRSAQIAQQRYAECKSNSNSNPQTCQSFLDSAQKYQALAAKYPQPLPK